MKTDIVRECTANYLQKRDSIIQQRTELQAKIDSARKRIVWHGKRIAGLSKRRDKIKTPRWTDEIVAPLMAEVARLTPGVAWDCAGQLHTHGLRAACSVYGTAENGETVGLTFTFDNDVLSYDTGETTRRFAPGTIGEVNGMNNVSAPVESAESLAAKVNGRINRLNTRGNEPV